MNPSQAEPPGGPGAAGDEPGRSPPTLVLSWRHTADDQRLWRAAVALGWRVERVRSPHVPSELADARPVFHLEGLFAEHVAARLGARLLDADLDWLIRLPARCRRREIALTTLGAARGLAGPRFVTPPNDKSFAARVYATGADLPNDLPGADVVRNLIESHERFDR